jgi:SAM-dependent methyltransferase
MGKTHYELPVDLDAESRLKTGAFYTPENIVDFMIARLLEGRVSPVKICDYACGSGAFLAGVLRYVRQKAPRYYGEWCAHLYGIDINPNALALARKNLPDIPDKNFICADTLSDSSIEKDKFDIIAGNPPYLCGGVRDREAFSAAEQARLKERFPNSFEYKMNLFALFIERAAFLADEFSLIVPDTLLCGRYFSKLRSFLLQNFQLKGLFLLEKPPFDASPGNAVILHACRRKKETPLQLTACCRFAPGSSLSRDTFHLVDQRRFQQESRCRFQLTHSAVEEKIIAKLFSAAVPLKELFSFASGIISKKGKKTIVTDTPDEGTAPALILGREVTPFQIRWRKNYLKLDPANIKSGLKHERFLQEKIFLRQTGASLIAAVSREKLYALNNCHVGTPLADFPLDTLAALLNSTVMTYLYRYLSGENNRNFAQIDIDLLKELPLRRDEAFDNFARECAASPAARAGLDGQCARLYGLTQGELDYIKSLMK